MIDALKLLALFGIGAALGSWLKGRTSLARRRLLVATSIVFGIPIAMFLCALALDSDTLAMIAGLSMMALAAAAVPVGLGFVVGRVLAGRSRGRGSSAGEQAVLGKPATAPPVMEKSTPSVDGSVVQRSPAVSANRRATLLAAAGVGSGFWVMIALGFRLHDQPVPTELDQGLIPAALVFVATVSLDLRAIWQRRGGSAFIFSRRSSAREQAEAMAKEQAWLATTAAYDLDPRATACCEHLAPIESEMRAVGLKVQLTAPSTVTAECVVDAEALAKRFSLPEGAGYQEWYSPDRSAQDPPHALLFCPAHYSRMWVVHAGEAKPGTPVFPLRNP